MFLRDRATSLALAEHTSLVVLEQHPPDQPIMTLYLTDDVFLRAYNWARWQLGIPLRPMQR